MSQKIWNDDFINALEQLEEIGKNKGNVFRARAYKKAADTLLLFQKIYTASNR